MVTQVPAGGLTSLEQLLVEHVGRGERLDLLVAEYGQELGGLDLLVSEYAEVGEEEIRAPWGETRACRATVIRDILRGRLAAGP